MRLRVLYNFSDLMYKSWRLLNLDPKNPVIYHASVRVVPDRRAEAGGLFLLMVVSTFASLS